MEYRATVIEADAEKALVRVASVNFGERGGLGILARNRERVMEFSADNRWGVKAGDEVILNVPSRRLNILYLVVFGMPVMAMAAAYFLGDALFGLFIGQASQGVGVAMAVAAGLVSFWGSVRLAERIGVTPTIEKVLDGVDKEREKKGGAP